MGVAVTTDCVYQSSATSPALAGGRQDDEVIVVVNGFPIVNQFVHLGVDVETLVIDNSTSTVATAWDLTDGILQADSASAPTGAFEVLSTEGAGPDQDFGWNRKRFTKRGDRDTDRCHRFR